MYIHTYIHIYIYTLYAKHIPPTVGDVVLRALHRHRSSCNVGRGVERCTQHFKQHVSRTQLDNCVHFLLLKITRATRNRCTITCFTSTMRCLQSCIVRMLFCSSLSGRLSGCGRFAFSPMTTEPCTCLVCRGTQGQICDWRQRLVDFGFAKHVTATTRSGSQDPAQTGAARTLYPHRWYGVGIPHGPGARSSATKGWLHPRSNSRHPLVGGQCIHGGPLLGRVQP